MYKQELVLLGIPICETTESKHVNPNLPSHEPLLPHIKNAKFYNCSTEVCEPVNLFSLTQITPAHRLRYCYYHGQKYSCQKLKYHSYKDVDKLLFLSNNIENKAFYLVDCLIYSGGERVCHKKDGSDSHTKLIDAGNIVRPKEANVLSQDEFICEEDTDKTINCDYNRVVPYADEFKLKDSVQTSDKILLKTGSSLVILEYGCLNSWCGFTGRVLPSRRMEHYEPPGKVYRCYYAKRQQVCKELYSKMRPVYNERDWLSS
ncbi:unnamed protein product [Leptosia nina]|uniref:Uncharacterized protein n=1 Tax=Leptosia nina TaxID=320188 RepID=A0AAV1JVS8_9NEOP